MSAVGRTAVWSSGCQLCWKTTAQAFTLPIKSFKVLLIAGAICCASGASSSASAGGLCDHGFPSRGGVLAVASRCAHVRGGTRGPSARNIDLGFHTPLNTPACASPSHTHTGASCAEDRDEGKASTPMKVASLAGLAGCRDAEQVNAGRASPLAQGASPSSGRFAR